MIKRALLDVLGAIGVPLLDRVIVKQFRDKEGLLEVRLCMRMSKVMAAGPDIADRSQGFIAILPASLSAMGASIVSFCVVQFDRRARDGAGGVGT